MGNGRLSRLVFGRKPDTMSKKTKEAISEVVRAVERAELRTKMHYQRAEESHLKAADAMRSGNETAARSFLDGWNYNQSLGEMYLQIHANLQRQLDVMQETEDLKVFADAFETARDIMHKEAPVIPVAASLQARAELNVKAAETRSTMRLFSRQMGVSGSMMRVDEELQRLRFTTNDYPVKKTLSPSPTVSTVLNSSSLETPTELKAEGETRNDLRARQ